MGGVRNREEKKKLNHVVSSGAGGSSKGPAIVDKRGQELQCPHCDKIYTQSGRLKEHIANKHPDAADTAATQPAAKVAPVKAAVAAAPPPTAPAASASSSAGGGMMDIGSKAGYYTSKSPKMHLAEWCESKGLPRPRYLPHKTKDGLATCKVVLPDAKKSENDVVVILDPAHAARADDMERQQRAAVAMLNHVAGDRSFHLLLPKPYVALWQALGELATARAAEAAARSAAEEQRRLKEVERIKQMNTRRPLTVEMPPEKMKMVQALLQGSALSLRPAASLLADEDTEAMLERTAYLRSLGFSPQHAQLAISQLGAHVEKDVMLEWLLLNLPVDQLPCRYASGSRAACITIIATSSTNNGVTPAAGKALPAVTSAPHSPLLQSIARLMAFGYSYNAGEAALLAAGQGAEFTAHQQLFSTLTGVHAAVRPSPASSPGDDSAWDDERVVLQSIYGDDAVCPDPYTIHLSLPLPDEAQPTDHPEPGARIVFTFQLCGADVSQLPCASSNTATPHPSEANGDCLLDTSGEEMAVHTTASEPCQQALPEQMYPHRPPLMAVACSLLAGEMLLHLTMIMATTAQKLLGEPMLHDVIVAALEAVALPLPKPVPVEGSDTTTSLQDEEAATEDAAAHLLADELTALAGGEQEDWEALEGMDAEEAAEVAAARVQRATEVTLAKQAAVQSAAMAEAEAAAVTGLQDVQNGVQALQTGHPEGAAQLTASEQHTTSSNGQGALPPPSSRQPRRRQPYIDIEAESRRLWQHQQALQQESKFAELRRSRGALPAAAKRGDLLAALDNSSALVISGATGCGKSTQVPQYILEDAVRRGCGAACNIVVTQPRRISALGLAHRVAAERGESAGDVVGYSVKMDSCTSARTRILFCTTGILLRRLLSDPALQGTTHVVLDEVHERSIEIDLLLLLLRDVAACRTNLQHASSSAQQHRQHQPRPQSTTLRLVLMSATADAQLFCDYIQASMPAQSGGPLSTPMGQPKGTPVAGGVAMLTIPGFTYPVREFYLEDIIELTGYTVGRNSRYARKGPRPRTKPAADAGSATVPNNDSDDGEVPLADPGSVATDSAASVDARKADGDTWEELAEGTGMTYCEATLKTLETVDEQQINYDALVELVALVLGRQQSEGPNAFLSDWPNAAEYLRRGSQGSSGAGGAILIFLPGAPEIGRLQRALTASERVAGAAGGRQGLRVLPLHGALSASDQTRVFNRPPPGVTKIVLATNVAETSITIDDVSFVIDTGRVKEMTHDPGRGILRLQEGWVSQASAQQRRGRAGRVRPGVCFRLFSTGQWRKMPSHTLPEMLRSPLESVVLLVKGMEAAAAHTLHAVSGGTAMAANTHTGGMPGQALGAGAKIDQVLHQCLSPPPTLAVEAAVTLLTAIGALDESERLTPLGLHLNRMPMDPRIGKMLLYGAMLGCLDSVLTVAAALAHGRPVYLSAPPDAQADVAAARSGLLAHAVSVKSDHVGLIAVYNLWQRALSKGGRAAGSAFCSQYSLSESTLQAMQSGRIEYIVSLADLGFTPSEAAADLRAAGSSSSSISSAWMQQSVNRNASNARFLKAAICAGFYPNILRVQHPPPVYVEVNGGAFESEPDPASVKFFDQTRGRTFIHPGSVNFKVGRYESGWLVYTQMTETSKLFVRECSMVPIYALLLFAGDLIVHHGEGTVSIGGWIQFRATSQVGVMVKELRSQLSRVLLDKVRNPGLDLSRSPVLAAVAELLTSHSA